MSVVILPSIPNKFDSQNAKVPNQVPGLTFNLANMLKKLVSVAITTLPLLLAAQPCTGNRYLDSLFTSSRTVGITYGGNYKFNGTWQDLKLDVYTPDSDTAANRPLIILAHQGAFLIGDKYGLGTAAMGRLAKRLATLGYVTASINYRLGYPNIINITDDDARAAIYRGTQDMGAAVRYFKRDVAENGNTYGIDSGRIIVGGSSAGAIMGLHTAYMDTEDEVASHIDTTGLGPLAGSSGNPNYSTDVLAVINLCGAILDTAFMQNGDQPIVSVHAPDDNVVPFGTDTISFSDSALIAYGSETIHQRADQTSLTDSFYVFYGGGHIPFSPNTDTGKIYLDTVFRLVRDFLYNRVICAQATGIREPPYLSFDIRPNPNDGRFSVQLDRPLEGAQVLRVYNAQGSIAFQQQLLAGTSESTLNITGPSGLYFVQMGNLARSLIVLN